jgi:hypothetical protein
MCILSRSVNKRFRAGPNFYIAYPPGDILGTRRTTPGHEQKEKPDPLGSGLLFLRACLLTKVPAPRQHRFCHDRTPDSILQA